MPAADETFLLGLLQGPAELLPISSSAHVGLLLQRRHPSLPGAARKEIEVALHAGTAIALALERPPIRWRFLTAATVPPALAGLVFERFVEERLGTPPTVAAGLVAGAVAMVAADRTPARRTEPDVIDGAALGVAQALALIPGVSRSGATRSAARARGFGRREAAELSRAVALPVLAGAAALKGARLIARACRCRHEFGWDANTSRPRRCREQAAKIDSWNWATPIPPGRCAPRPPRSGVARRRHGSATR